MVNVRYEIADSKHPYTHDAEFNKLHARGRMEWTKLSTPFNFPVFLVWRTVHVGSEKTPVRKPRVVVDIRGLSKIAIKIASDKWHERYVRLDWQGGVNHRVFKHSMHSSHGEKHREERDLSMAHGRIFSVEPTLLGQAQRAACFIVKLTPFYISLSAFLLIPSWVLPWTRPRDMGPLNAVRPYLEGIHMEPHYRAYSEIPWYLDLWNYQTENALYLGTLHPPIEATVISLPSTGTLAPLFLGDFFGPQQ